jgi:hypothetical protein
MHPGKQSKAWHLGKAIQGKVRHLGKARHLLKAKHLGKATHLGKERQGNARKGKEKRVCKERYLGHATQGT